MATRFYFPSSGTAPASPTVSAEWEHNNGVRRPFFPYRTGTTLTGTTYTPDAADHIADQDSMFVQFVGPALYAQTISAQTVKWAIQGLESNAGDNCFLTVKIMVYSNNGGTLRGTILAIRRDATELATTNTNRTDSATSTSVTAVEGDRIVVEVGIGGLPVASGGTQGHNGTLTFGDNQSSDLAENDTETGSTFNPWLEFANTIAHIGNSPWRVYAPDTLPIKKEVVEY